MPGNTVSMINERDCHAQDVSRCQGPWPTITVGNMPSGIAIDTRPDTVYVTNVQDNTVSVFNGATCNAENTSGCRQTPATVPVGLDPLGLFADPANHTVYVANYGAPALGGPPGDSTTVSMIDSATCNATNLAACPKTAHPTVDVGASPDDVELDQATHTVVAPVRQRFAGAIDDRTFVTAVRTVVFRSGGRHKCGRSVQRCCALACRGGEFPVLTVGVLMLKGATFVSGLSRCGR